MEQNWYKRCQSLSESVLNHWVLDEINQFVVDHIPNDPARQEDIRGELSEAVRGMLQSCRPQCIAEDYELAWRAIQDQARGHVRAASGRHEFIQRLSQVINMLQVYLEAKMSGEPQRVLHGNGAVTAVLPEGMMLSHVFAGEDQADAFIERWKRKQRERRRMESQYEDIST